MTSHKTNISRWIQSYNILLSHNHNSNIKRKIRDIFFLFFEVVMKNSLLPVHWFANRLHACLSQKITWAGLCLYSESKESGREIVNTLAIFG